MFTSNTRDSLSINPKEFMPELLSVIKSYEYTKNTIRSYSSVKLLLFSSGNLTLLEYEKRAWNPLIEFYKKNGCVVDADTFLATIRI